MRVSHHSITAYNFLLSLLFSSFFPPHGIVIVPRLLLIHKILLFQPPMGNFSALTAHGNRLNPACRDFDIMVSDTAQSWVFFKCSSHNDWTQKTNQIIFLDIFVSKRTSGARWQENKTFNFLHDYIFTVWRHIAYFTFISMLSQL